VPDVTSTRLRLGATLAALATASGSASAQTEIRLELGASQVGPALGVDADDARFAIGGLRVSHERPTGSGVYASLLGGQVLGNSRGGSFLSGLLEARAIDTWTTRWSGSIDARFLAFEVKDPFPYRTLAFELGPTASYRTPSLSLKIGALGGLGRSRIELWRHFGGATRVFEDDHWRFGGTGELLVGSPTVQVGIAGSAHKASDELYHSVGGRLIVGGDWGVVELRADRWDTPVGFETTGGLAVAILLGRSWSFRGFFGRSDPDPLTLAQPGSGGGGGLLGWSMYSTAPTEAPSATLYEVVEQAEAHSRVRLVLETPEAAARVQVLGDFTLWDPVEMDPEGNRWTVELEVGVGTHHFGFLVDDEWYVPDDAPNLVPDEWGRLSATLVVEGAGS
jgi:hypothetical protein